MGFHAARAACSLALFAIFMIPVAGQAGEGEKLFWFQFQEEYRARFASSYSSPTLHSDEESDHDVRLLVSSGIRDSSAHFRGYLSAGGWLDVDGRPAAGSPSVLSSSYDLDSSLWLDVFSLYGEYHSEGMLRLARVGRQAVEFGLPIVIDGAFLEVRPLAPAPWFDLFAFGGRSVHFFEAHQGLLEDWVGSAGAVIRPMERLRLVVDYRFLLEETHIVEELKDHTYGAEVWYAPLDWFSAKAYGRGIGSSASHVGGATRMAWHELGLGVDLKVDSQVSELREVNEVENPYFAILGASLPHTRWGMDLWKSFNTSAGDFGIHAGWTGRANHENETTFNRDYGKLYLLLEASDIGVKGPFVSLSVENHFANLTPTFDEEGVLTAGGAAGYRNRLLRAEAGSYYQRFKYDYYDDVQEYENVRTFFGSFSVKPVDWLSIRARYTMEQLDRDIHTVLFTLTQSY
jgi:hypothetical protein